MFGLTTSIKHANTAMQLLSNYHPHAACVVNGLDRLIKLYQPVQSDGQSDMHTINLDNLKHMEPEVTRMAVGLERELNTSC